MRDPVEEQMDDDREDLYDVATWEVRSALDRLAVGFYVRFGAGMGNPLATLGAWVTARSPRIDLADRGDTIVNIAVVWLVLQFWLVLATLLRNLPLGLATALSAVPAVVFLRYVRKTDQTMREPSSLLAVTFLLGVLLGIVGFLLNIALVPVFELLVGPVAGVVESAAEGVLDPGSVDAAFGIVSTAALALSVFLIVGPVEEGLKWLAVRTYAYGSAPFDTVVDGAVYGAMAGFGFATVENTIYIGFEAMGGVGIVEPLGSAAWGTIIFTRAFLGPGNVVFAAFAGYYLGLAKFNADAVGPIVVKGLLAAVLLHGTYSLIGTYLITTGFPRANLVFVGYIVVFNGIVGYVLLRKLARYRDAFRRATGAGSTSTARAN